MSKVARNRNRNVCLKVEKLEERLNLTPPVPVYNSNPGAFAQLYVDFDGHTEPSGWCGTSGQITVQVFSIDANLTTYSPTELSIIDSIMLRMSEDYAPFNINVTTVVPSDFANKHAIRVTVGDPSGGGINWGSIGGIACLGSFYNSAANTVFTVPDGLGNSSQNIAMAGSHEAGHSFGLNHQDEPAGGCGGYHDGGVYNGETKGPIMGAPFSVVRDIWWKGFEGCGTQDDMGILSNANNGYGYVADDESDTFDLARRIRTSGGVFVGDLSGIIGKTTDLDIYAFTSPPGSATINVNVATVGFNLDSILEVYHDQAGTPVLLGSHDSFGNAFNSSVTVALPGGKHYVVVKSDGDYGEVGQYTISGTLSIPPSPGFFGEGLGPNGFKSRVTFSNDQTGYWSGTDIVTDLPMAPVQRVGRPELATAPREVFPTVAPAITVTMWEAVAPLTEVGFLVGGEMTTATQQPISRVLQGNLGHPDFGLGAALSDEVLKL
jgi:hypothetical protein